MTTALARLVDDHVPMSQKLLEDSNALQQLRMDRDGETLRGDETTAASPLVIAKELAPLVAMPPPSAATTTNRLSKQTYSRLGRNLLFEARPAVSAVNLPEHATVYSPIKRLRGVTASQSEPTSQRKLDGPERS